MPLPACAAHGSKIIRREHELSFLSPFSLHSLTRSMQMENFETMHRGYIWAGESLHASHTVLIKLQKRAQTSPAGVLRQSGPFWERKAMVGNTYCGEAWGKPRGL